MKLVVIILVLVQLASADLDSGNCGDHLVNLKVPLGPVEWRIENETTFIKSKHLRGTVFFSSAIIRGLEKTKSDFRFCPLTGIIHGSVFLPVIEFISNFHSTLDCMNSADEHWLHGVGYVNFTLISVKFENIRAPLIYDRNLKKMQIDDSDYDVNETVARIYISGLNHDDGTDATGDKISQYEKQSHGPFLFEILRAFANTRISRNFIVDALAGAFRNSIT